MSTITENILSDNDKTEIVNSLKDIFGDMASGEILFNFQKFKIEVNKLIKEMGIDTINPRKYTAHLKNKPIEIIRYDMAKEVARRNFLAMKGYLLIFKFREYLLDSKMNYRYYYIDESGNTGLKEFGDFDLLNFVSFSNASIQLNPTKIINESKEGQDFLRQKMDQYIRVYTNPDKNKYMQKVEAAKYNLRTVRSHIMKRYEGMNPGLRAKSGLYQTFNMGHIYESLDISLTDMLLNHSKKEQKSQKAMDSLMFGKYLKRDSVIASRGGDNFLTNTSIKSNKANLYSFNTISHQLVLISQLLNATTKEDLLAKIKYLFIDESDKSDAVKDRLEKSAQLAANKLLEQIESSIKSK